MLDLVTSLGRKRGHGNGAVLRWEVETMADDWSVMRNGRLTRAMPDGYAPGRRRMGGIRPLYWHRSRQMALVVPHERDLVPCDELRRRARARSDPGGLHRRADRQRQGAARMGVDVLPRRDHRAGAAGDMSLNQAIQAPASTIDIPPSILC